MSEFAAHHIVLLTRSHNRKAFSCGNQTLDQYLQRQARQDMQRNLAQAFVLLDEDETTIMGYYTLSASSLQLSELPVETIQRLPRYPKIPVTLLGRLAIDSQFQGQGVGAKLLANALFRSWEQTAEIGSMAVVVDAIDDNAINFYKKYHFIALPNAPRTLFLEMAAIKKLLA